MKLLTYSNIHTHHLDNLASSLSSLLMDGGLVCLYGDIGTGKTTFIKAICKHMGVQEDITSPSFIILNEYQATNLPIYHFDLYRLEDSGVESILCELDEYMYHQKALTFIEWANFSNVALPNNRLDVFIEYAGDDTQRKFIFSSHGTKWDNVLEQLSQHIQLH